MDDNLGKLRNKLSQIELEKKHTNSEIKSAQLQLSAINEIMAKSGFILSILNGFLYLPDFLISKRRVANGVEKIKKIDLEINSTIKKICHQAEKHLSEYDESLSERFGFLKNEELDIEEILVSFQGLNHAFDSLMSCIDNTLNDHGNKSALFTEELYSRLNHLIDRVQAHAGIVNHISRKSGVEYLKLEFDLCLLPITSKLEFILSDIKSRDTIDRTALLKLRSLLIPIKKEVDDDCDRVSKRSKSHKRIIKEFKNEIRLRIAPFLKNLGVPVDNKSVMDALNDK